MSEIDVDRCPHLTGVVHCGYMECEMGKACDLDCEWYQLQKLKQENNELREMYRLSCLKCKYKNTKADLDKAEQKLEKIKEYCKIHTDFCKNNNRTCEVCSFEPCEDIQILQIIEGVK